MCALNKLPVANRGDIAVRLIRVARALGWSRVAVYSEADAGAPHMALADQAVSIGPAAAESYLSISRLSEAARATDAYAVHPGRATPSWPGVLPLRVWSRRPASSSWARPSTRLPSWAPSGRPSNA